MTCKCVCVISKYCKTTNCVSLISRNSKTRKCVCVISKYCKAHTCVCAISRYCKTRKCVCVISNSSRVFHVVPILRRLCLRANEVHQVLVKKSQQLHISRCSRPLYLGTSIFCLGNTLGQNGRSVRAVIEVVFHVQVDFLPRDLSLYCNSCPPHPRAIRTHGRV